VLELMDAWQVAKLFGISRRTVYAWIAKDILPPGAKIGQRRLFDKADIQRARAKIEAQKFARFGGRDS
jgi:excisionase family DNA binding protein